MTDETDITTIEINGQPVELVRGAAYEFGFHFPRHTVIAARFLSIEGRDLTLETLDGRTIKRSVRDLENLWDTPQPGVKIPR